MARTVEITVNVKDEQFNQFIQNFNAFSNKLKGINTQFQQINQTIQNTQKQSNALLNTMRSVHQAVSSLLQPVASITTHFLKWSTIIGGVTALLGLGGGLFGIERLANSIMQKRRQVMGLGGTYGGVQASQIYGQSLFGGGTGDILKNIRMGMGGSIEQLTPLLAMGIPFGTKDKPEDVLTKLLKRMPELLKSGGPGLELMTAKAYGIDKIFTDPMDIIRMSTEAGAKEIEEREKLIAAHRKELELSPKAQKAWSDLEMQFQKAAAHIETIFGEKLASLAGPLSKLSESFEHLIKILMDSGIVEKIIKQMTKWINQLADYLKSDKLQKDLKQFTDEVESWLPWLKQLGENLKTFGDVLGNIVGVLSRIWSVVKFLDRVEGGVQSFGRSVFGGGGGGTSSLTPQSGAGYDTVTGPSSKTPRTQAPTAQSPSTTPSALPPGAVHPDTSRSVLPTPYGMPGAGSTNNFTLPVPNQGPNIFGVTPGASIGGSSSSEFNQKMGGIINNKMGLAGGNQFAAFNNRFGGGNTSFTGGSTRNSWAAAAGKAAPDNNMGINFNQNTRVANVDKRSQQGPLSASNWQSSRTAKLEIRNVPGANVFMTGAGMSV